MSIPKKRARQYFEAEPETPSRPHSIRLRLPGLELELETDAQVFSGGRVDPGTLVLLREAPPPPPEGDLLDLGCGYGPIALALARRAPAARVWAVDANLRALELTRRNAERAAVGALTACLPEQVPPELTFAAIYSNPPVRVGKAALHGLLLAWLPRLAPGAHAYLVVQTHLGADSLARWLGGQGFSVRRLASKHSYRVLDVAREG